MLLGFNLLAISLLCRVLLHLDTTTYKQLSNSLLGLGAGIFAAYLFFISARNTND